MLLRELLGRIDDSEFVEIHADMELEIQGIASDSRRVCAGFLFVCLSGTKTDGHSFIADAVARGAVCVIVRAGASFALPDGVGCASVEDTRRMCALLWDAWYGHPSAGMKVIAITGTNGKTSTSYMVRAIMRAAGYRTGLIGTVRCLIGDEEYGLDGGSELFGAASAMTTPDPEGLYGAIAEMRRRGVEVLIMEASSHALELEKLAGLASCGKLDVGVFTNLSPEHLDFHGDMERYFRAKAKLFPMCRVGIVNVDDSYAAALMEDGDECRFVGCSAEPGTIVNPAVAYTAVQLKSHGIDGVEYILYAQRAVFRVRSMIPGMFTVYNTMQAIACALELGVDLVTVQDAVRNLTGVDGRLERVKLDATKADFAVFIDYAHTAAALENMLLAVRGFRSPGQRITLVFGCGGDRDASKRRPMGAVASRLADFVIVTSDNPRTEDPQRIITEIMKGIDKEKPHLVMVSRREAIRYAVEHARPGEILVLAGKGHEKYEIDAQGKHPFDEAELVRQCVAALELPRDGEKRGEKG